MTVLEDWGDWKGVVDRMSLSGLRSMLAGQAPQRWYMVVGMQPEVNVRCKSGHDRVVMGVMMVLMGNDG